jgi:hypothetical protein
MDAIVRMGDAYIHYNISREGPGIYQARLIRYEGCPTEEPPRDVVLTRGYRCWAGSANHPLLLNELGKMIDSLSSSYDPDIDAHIGRPASL